MAPPWPLILIRPPPDEPAPAAGEYARSAGALVLDMMKGHNELHPYNCEYVEANVKEHYSSATRNN